jgi:hypothetical protein
VNDIIRSVLELSAGSPWPPDHLTLVGLSKAEATPARVESAVMERMGRLRNYQLAHPDEVTEAMNRLARAMVELTRPAATVMADAERKPAPVETPKALELAPELPAGMDSPEVEDDNKSVPRRKVVSAPVLELLPESYVFPSEPAVVRRPFEEMRKTDAPSASPPNWIERVPPVQHLPEASWPYPVAPGSRQAARRSPQRDAIHAAVRYRRLLRAWDSSGTFLAQPEIVAMTRAECVAVLLALSEIESGQWALNENSPGGSVMTFARTRPNVGALWELTFSTRESLRDDWRAGRQHLLGKYQRSRQASQRRRPWRELRRQWLRVRDVLPQATAIAVSGVATVVGLVRLFT